MSEPAPLQPEGRKEGFDPLAAAMEGDRGRRAAREAAFAGIYWGYKRKLLAYARTCLRAAADVEDLVHDVMLGAWKKDLMKRCGRDQDCIESYLMAAMRNRVFDEFRLQGREGRKVTRFAASLLARLSAADLTSRRADERDMERHVNRVIMELPLRCREVFIARRVLEMSTEEAAAYLGLRAKTVKTQLTRAHALLRPKLAALGYYCLPEAKRGGKEDTR